jgi:hypothetical protein
MYNHKASAGIVVDGVFSELAYTGSQNDLVQGQKYNLKATAKGQEITLYVDGVRTLSFIDGTHMNGMAGFRVWGSLVTYDYIKIAVPIAVIPPDYTIPILLLLGGAVVLATSSNILGVIGIKKKQK